MKNRLIHLIYASILFLAAVWGYAFIYRFGAAGFLLPNDGVRWVAHLRGLLLILGGSIGIPLIAEWVGFAISKWLGEGKDSAKQFSMAWARGVVLFLIITFASAICLIQAGRSDNALAPYLVAGGLMVILILVQSPVHWIISGRRSGGHENVPGRLIGSLLALFWNLMGLYLAKTFHEQASFFSAAGVVLIGFGMVLPVSVGYILFSVLEKLISKSDNPIAKWNTSGMILYLSWFCFGFIARLTPATLGRPDRWAGTHTQDRPPQSAHD